MKEIYKETKQVALPVKKGKPQEFKDVPYLLVEFDEKKELVVLSLDDGRIKISVTPNDAKTIIRGLSQALDFYNVFKNQK